MIIDEKIDMTEADIKSRRPTRLSLELLVRAKKKELLLAEEKVRESAHHGNEKSKLK